MSEQEYNPNEELPLPSDVISVAVLRERFPEINDSPEDRRLVFRKIDSLMTAERAYVSAARLCRDDPSLSGLIDVPRRGQELVRALLDLRATPTAADQIVLALAERIRDENPRPRTR